MEKASIGNGVLELGVPGVREEKQRRKGRLDFIYLPYIIPSGDYYMALFSSLAVGSPFMAFIVLSCSSGGAKQKGRQADRQTGQPAGRTGQAGGCKLRWMTTKSLDTIRRFDDGEYKLETWDTRLPRHAMPFGARYSLRWLWLWLWLKRGNRTIL
ncbi:hypothetical protein B0H65DRAFT_473121 [Neurospora tetraspora]|uniref:Uncharacterized protein n=1 Tax=Neurospora tetraspora TaxID=94610 RepID=A0AAE0MPY5_9PEZI|nr:hypothetical protein B0H65DRAFT_473121 [Neurospora tetraspora]